MNERHAWAVLVVKAMETSPQPTAWISPAQQQAASEAALASAPRPASAQRTGEWAQQWLVKRAQWLLNPPDSPHAAHTAPAPGWTWAWLVLAFAVGWATEHVFSPDRIHLLSPALLGVLAWNALVLAGLLLGPVLGLIHQRIQRLRPSAPPGLRPPLATAAPPLNGLAGVALGLWWRVGLGWQAHGARQALPPGPWQQAPQHQQWQQPPQSPQSQQPTWRSLRPALQRDWLRVAGPAMRLRLAAHLHAGSALVALGLIASLAWKGLYGEYRVGWASAWLDPVHMHGLLSALATLVGSPPFSLATIERLNGWAQVPPPGVGTAWFWLVAKLLVLAVVLPRGALAGVAAWRARRLSQHLTLALNEPYFASLLATLAPHHSGLHTGLHRGLRIWPCSYTLSEAQQAALRRAAQALHGAATTVVLMPNTPHGQLPDTRTSHSASRATDTTTGAGVGAGAAAPHPVALFSLAATPEAEVHGQAISHLQAHTTGELEVWADRAPLRRQLGHRGSTRLAEREALWHTFATQHHARLRLIDLDT